MAIKCLKVSLGTQSNTFENQILGFPEIHYPFS